MVEQVAIRDRIKELRRVKASELIPDERNWRRHPDYQRDALAGVLAEIGYADALLARETPEGLKLIDGHLRAELTPDIEVPVLVLDVTEEEAAQIMLTKDPLAAMAQTNQDALMSLLSKTPPFESAATNDMLEALANDEPRVLPNMYPEIPDGDKSPIGQMTFTVTADQKQAIEAALSASKSTGDFANTGNENSNGNALALICQEYVNG